MRISYYLCFISLLVSGCASTVELNSIDKARKEIGNRSAIIHLKSDKEYQARDLQVGKNSVRFVNSETKDTLQLPYRDIKFMKVINNKAGIGEGFLIGAVSVGVPMVILGSIGHSDDENKGGRFRDAFTLIGFGGGGVLGLAIGGVSGHKYTYIFQKDTLDGSKDTSVQRDSITYRKRKEIIPIEQDKRIKIRFVPFEDLTGAYHKAAYRLEKRVSSLLDSSFIRTVEYSRRKGGYSLVKKQNPFISCSDFDTSSMTIEVRGEVEVCSCEKYSDIKERMIKHNYLDLLGSTAYADSNLCGFVQIRLNVFDHDGKQIQNILAVGASCDDTQQLTKEDLINKAITQASKKAYEDLSDLLIKHYKLNPLIQKDFISEKEAQQIRSLD